MLAAWATVLSWRVLTDDFAEVGIPLLFIGVVARRARRARRGGAAIHPAAIVAGQLRARRAAGPRHHDRLAVPDARQRRRLPGRARRRPGELAQLCRARAVRRPARAPAAAHRRHAGRRRSSTSIACTLRRAPVAGLVLLAAYTLPVAVTGDAVSWWLFSVVAGLFLTLVFLQHSDHVTSWGRAPEGEKGSFSVRTGAIGNTALALGAASIALAVVVPAAVPTMSMSVFDGNGPGTREVEVKDPMVDLRRDLSRGEDIPLLWVTTSGPRPTYLRLSVLARFNGSAWTPGDRDDPREQIATGALPPLDGVALSVPRKRVQVRRPRRSGLEARRGCPPPRRSPGSPPAPTGATTSTPATSSRPREDVTTADRTYDFTGAQLTYDAEAMNTAVSGAGSVAGIFTEVPTNLNNEVRRLAASVTADGPTRFQKAQLLQQWFREDGGFRYDKAQVESAGNGGADLMAFLDEKVGYCEQFAATMAIMARVIGIPSRVAVGFLEPEKSTNGAWEFSAHDLHAWPELYFPGSGWVRFEPTPQDRADQVPDYTTADFAPVTASPSPSASRSTELLPDRGESPSAADGTADEDSTSIPWVPVLAGRARPRPPGDGAPHPPPRARRASSSSPRRRHRGPLGRDARRGARPGPRLAGRALAPTRRRVARPTAGDAGRRCRPPRPAASWSRPGTGGRRGPRPPRAGPRAQPLRPRTGDLHRRAVPRRRRPGRGVAGRGCHPPRRTSCSVVAAVGRRASDVVARPARACRARPRCRRRDHDHGDPGRPGDPDGRPAHRLSSGWAARGGPRARALAIRQRVPRVSGDRGAASAGTWRTDAGTRSTGGPASWVCRGQRRVRSRARGGDATAPPCAP